MKYILILLVILLPVFSPYLLKNIAPLSHELQNSCLIMVNPEIIHSEFLSAFVCGVDPQESSAKTSWKQSGLYHLLVVSGSHLVFIAACLGLLETQLKKLLTKWEPQPRLASSLLDLLVTACLIFLCLMTGFQAPLVRALIQRLIRAFSQKFFLFWSPCLTITASGAFCLLFFPSWINSPSLLLSWLASLALSLRGSEVLRSWTIYLFMLPLLWGWGQVHPLTVLFNLALAPIAGLGLLAAGVLSLLSQISSASFLISGASEILKAVNDLLNFANEICPLTAVSSQLPLGIRWATLILLSGFAHALHTSKQRHRCAGSWS